MSDDKEIIVVYYPRWLIAAIAVLGLGVLSVWYRLYEPVITPLFAQGLPERVDVLEVLSSRASANYWIMFVGIGGIGVCLVLIAVAQLTRVVLYGKTIYRTGVLGRTAGLPVAELRHVDVQSLAGGRTQKVALKFCGTTKSIEFGSRHVGFSDMMQRLARLKPDAFDDPDAWSGKDA